MPRKDRYGLFAETGKPFDAALQSLRDALKAKGFGILWEIDVRATMNAKLGVDFPPYVILGACNPPIAHQALTADPEIGLLLPCNCVARQERGRVILSAVEPHALMSLTRREDLAPFADRVEELLAEALELAAGS
jgi:uncharacterized protein (DUF302 family)